MVQRANTLLKSDSAEEAQALAEQALAMDADAAGLAELRSRLAKKLGTIAAAAPAPAPAAPPPAVVAPATPAPPNAAATAAAAAASEKAAKERAAKLAEDKARKAEEKRLADEKKRAAAASRAPAPATAPATAPAPPAAPDPPPQAAAPAGRGNALVAISTPQPPYPPTALRGQVSGEVTVSFTVNVDGSVGNVRVVSARPRGVFDRGVASTVAGWRFQPIDQPRSTTRTITFEP
jgi:protein TonB